MTPNDSEPPNNNGDASSDSPLPKTPRGNGLLTPEAFDKLLERLSPDRDEAGKEYVLICNKLTRFFERRSVNSPEDRVDEVINRVAKKIDEGKQIVNVLSYAYKVAHFVYWESLKEPQPVDMDLDPIPAPEQVPEPDDDYKRVRQICFDYCLAKLTGEIRDQILAYHREKGHAKIELRRQLAATLKIPLNALRIRAHRIRAGLEACIKECLSQHGFQDRNVSG